MMPQVVIPRGIVRFPCLDTLLMVERFLQQHDGEFTRLQAWKHLPKRMMYQTFKVAVEYLLYSRKISVDKEGKLGWIFYPGRSIKPGLFWRDDAAR